LLSLMYLFDINLDELKAFLKSMNAADKEQIIQTADMACKGRIRGFSSIDLDYGNPIEWQLNPLTAVSCDQKSKWYRIPDFDKKRGDIKVIWEASRFSHFLTFARAFLLTENEKYYNAFSEQLSSWLKQNSYGYGANFKCSQECSLRMVNTLLAYSVFRKAGIVTESDQSNVKDLVSRCYRKVLSNFFYAYKCIKNNHTISELMGMIVGAWCCGDQKQVNKAFRLLDEVIDEQFTDDGGYRQFSFNYQRLALQDIEVVLSVEDRVGRRLVDKSREKIKKASLLMYQCQDETNDMPNYGSNDGALVFPVTACAYRDFRPVINTIYALITGKRLYEDDCPQEELIWFSKGKRLQQYGYEKVSKKSSQFPEAGIFTIRNRNSWLMVVLNDYKSRPAHLDQLHLDLWVDGVNIFCDAGTYSYASELGRKLAKNESHNTAVVDRKPQMDTQGPFLIYNWSERRLGAVSENRFEGTVVSKNGYSHTRRIDKSSSGYVIEDYVDMDYSVMFHTPCGVRLDGRKKVVLSWNGKTICTITTDGTLNLEKTKRSLYYLRIEDTNCIVIKGRADQKIKTMIKIEEKQKDG